MTSFPILSRKPYLLFDSTLVNPLLKLKAESYFIGMISEPFLLTKPYLPFNLIAGWSIKLEKAPIQFSVTAQRLSVWNNSYYDVNFANQEGYKAPGSMQNLFNHLIVGSEVYMGSQVDLNFGYNFIRRFDLNVQNQQNWFNGFSAGLGIQLPRTKIQYGNAFFQRNLYHHFSVFYSLKNK
jgi:hypothetical protein